MKRCSYVFLLFVLLLGGSLPHSSSVPTPALTIASACTGFGIPEYGSGYSTGISGLHDYTVAPEAIAFMLSLPADRSIWLGYGNGIGGFGWHEDTSPILNLTLYSVDGTEYWFEVWYSQTDYRYYALPYADITRHGDAFGNFMGYHPCGAFEMEAQEYAALIEALGAV